MTTLISSTNPVGANTWQPTARLTGGIVVAVDGSPESLIALETARLLSEQKGWRVHVVSLLPPFASYVLDGGYDQPESEIEALRLQLRGVALRDLLRNFEADPDWSTDVLVGKSAPLIAGVVDSRGADLLIMGRPHFRGTETSPESDPTLATMGLSAVPVLTVGRWAGGTDTVVVATDFSEASDDAARGAIELMGTSGKLYLVYVELPGKNFSAGRSSPHDCTCQSNISDRFRSMIARLDAPRGIVVEPVHLSGKPVTSILEFSERTGVQLIAVGSRRHTRDGRCHLGSVSAGLVCGATAGVLVTFTQAQLSVPRQQ